MKPVNPSANLHYNFEQGFPTAEAIRQAYDDMDRNRAIQAYRFFYPTVSFATGFMAVKKLGLKINATGAIMEGSPKQLVFTANSDTPYGVIPVDLKAGPVVVELPPGPIMGVVNDLNQHFVMDMGLPGPDKGKGGKHLIMPPDSKDVVPSGYYASPSTTNQLTVALRALPIGGDKNAAIELLKTVKVYPLAAAKESGKLEWINISDQAWDMTPLSIETTLGFWELLHEIINNEPVFDAYRNYYGELAALGITKGKPFAPDERMQGILEEAAQIANAQMRVQSFADRRPDRFPWPDRKWEWLTLTPDSGTFDMPSFVDLEAREKWFFQAIIESPAMFGRTEGQGSLYWLGVHDNKGFFLNGGKSYNLRIPQPVPAKLFWSVTVYDALTRSEIQTDQNKAALSSLYDLKNKADKKEIEFFFGPKIPEKRKELSIKTIPDRGWFAYFRIYGPEAQVFDGSWKLNDFEEIITI